MIRRALPFTGGCGAIAVLAAVLFAATPAFAQETEEAAPLPETAPVPVERPEGPIDETDIDEDTEDGDAEGEAEAGEDASPDAQSEEENSEAGEEEADAAPAALEPPAPEDPAALRTCRAELRGLGAEFRRVDPILPADESEAGCGVAVPFSVAAILPDVTLQPETRMRCEVALALARWTLNEVQPAADALEMGRLTAIDHGSTYVCRGRNNDAAADLSEHAKGNAIDVMSLTFDTGETVAVVPREGDGTDEEAFQRAIRGGACLYFKTVLGPGSDAYHDDHLHLDLAERSSGYRLCQ